MSRDSSRDPKGVAAGYGLLAAAQALNSSVGPGRASQSGARMEHFDFGTGSGLNMQGSRSHYSPSAGSSHGMAASFDDQSKGQDAYASQGRSPLDKARSLFASLGLSAEEFEVLSNVPEEKLNVETLPRLIMQLKSQRAEERGLPSRPRDNLSPPREQPYRPVRDDWDEAACSRPDSKKESNAVPRVFNYNYGQQREGPSRSYERLDYEERMGGSDRYPEPSRGHYESEYDRRGPAPVPERSFMERRTGFPSLSKIEDYHGILPKTFPHVCTLCDFDVHSVKSWSRHIDGSLHAHSQQLLLDQYPEWIPKSMPSRDRQDPLEEEATNGEDGFIDTSPVGHQRRGVSSDWSKGGGISSQDKRRYSMKAQGGGKVVVAKYLNGTCYLEDLLELAEPFGTVVNHLVVVNKTFLEMLTPEEAASMVKYYQRTTPMVRGHAVQVYLSSAIKTIQTPGRVRAPTQSQDSGYAVVYICNLPPSDFKDSELIELAKRFGPVWNSLILKHEAFVEMVNPRDAEMMVKYYTIHPPKLNGKKIKIITCKKYRRLKVKPGTASHRGKDSSSSSSGRTNETSGKSKQSRSRERASTAKEEGGSSGKEEQEEPGDQGSEVMDMESNALEEEEGVELGEEEDPEEPDPFLDCTETQGEEPKEQSLESSETQEEGQVEASLETSATQGQQAEKECLESLETQVEQPAEKTLEGLETQEEGTAEKPPEGPGTQGVEPAAKAPESLETQELETADTSLERSETQREAPGEEDSQPADEKAAEASFPKEEEGTPEFPDNLEDLVTLDEVGDEEEAEMTRLDLEMAASSSSSAQKEKEGLKMVNVSFSKKGYNLVKEILRLAEPFGKVVFYKILEQRNEAILEMSSMEEARQMVDFYKIKPAMLYRASVKITLLKNFHGGRVVYFHQLPSSYFPIHSLLKLARRFGKVKYYVLIWIRNEAFIEMETSRSALEMCREYKKNPPTLNGKMLSVYLSWKDKLMKGRRAPSCSPSPEPPKRSKRERPERSKREDETSSSSKSRTKEREEGPPQKRGRSQETGEQGESPVKTREGEQKQTKDKVLLDKEAAGSQQEKETAEEPSLSEGEAGVPFTTDVEVSDEAGLPEGLGAGASASNKVSSQAPHKQGDKSESTEETLPMTVETEPMETEIVHKGGACDSANEQHTGTDEKTVHSIKPEPTPTTLGPYQLNNPVGVEHVKAGFYCGLCSLFYTSEEAAKVTHCSSLAHYQKLQEMLNKENTAAERSSS